MSESTIQIRSFEPHLAEHFKAINMLWIEQLFAVEAEDLRVLEQPEQSIIVAGGEILFAQYQQRIVGTCGLKKWSDSEYELIKMAVLADYQGLKIGWLLGQAIIKLAIEKGAKRLFLETNHQLKPALRLYQKLGFQEVKAQSSKCDYHRCDIVMEFNL